MAKHENKTIREHIYATGNISLTCDIDRMTNHKSNTVIFIDDTKEIVSAMQCSTDPKFSMALPFLVTRLENGAYEVGVDENKYIIPAFLTKAQLKPPFPG